MSSQLIGMKELTAKLNKMDAKLAAKTLKSAMMFATGPVIREMKLAAPVGTVAHKTYKGRLVAPGYLSRSVIRRGALTKKGYGLQIGVKPEAFYGVSLLDSGVSLINTRSMKATGKGGAGKQIKPYGIKAHNWFEAKFAAKSSQMTERFRKKLAERIERAMQ